MNRAWVLLGSNVDKERHLPAAVSALRDLGLVAVSRAFETAPVGTDHPETFLNAAAVLETEASEAEIRAACRAIEDGLGRVRDPDDPFMPRTIDLDLVIWNGEVRDDDVHREVHAAVPLADVTPELVVTEDGRTLAEVVVRLVASFFPRPRPDVILSVRP